MNNNKTTEQDSSPAKVGLYWRTGWFTFAPTHPGIMTFENGNISFKTKDKILFEKNISDASAVFTVFGTLVLTIDNIKYSFITGNNTGIMHRPFTLEQIQELEAAGQRPKDGLNFLGGAGLVAGGKILQRTISGPGSDAIGMASRVTGTVVMFKEQHEGFKMMLSWAGFLENRGLNVDYKTKSYAKMQLAAGGIVLSIMAITIGLIALMAMLDS